MARSRATVAYKEFAGRSQFTGVAPGREGVADHALEWGTRHARDSAADGAEPDGA